MFGIKNDELEHLIWGVNEWHEECGRGEEVAMTRKYKTFLPFARYTIQKRDYYVV